MKNKIRLSATLVLMFLAISTMFIYTSCKDKCKKVLCLNNGTCDDGICNCPNGYEGTDCGDLSRDKFTGVYELQEDCSNTAASTYNVTISINPADITKVTISNFHKMFLAEVSATVDHDMINIPSQQPANNGITVSGSGSISNGGNTVTLNYTISGGSDDVCTSAVLTRK